MEMLVRTRSPAQAKCSVLPPAGPAVDLAGCEPLTKAAPGLLGPEGVCWSHGGVQVTSGKACRVLRRGDSEAI